MIRLLTRNPVTRALGRYAGHAAQWFADWKARNDKGGLIFRVMMGVYCISLGVFFMNTLLVDRGIVVNLESGDGTGEIVIDGLPGLVPIVFQGLAVCLAFAAFLATFWIGQRTSLLVRRRLVVLSLSLAALAALAAWLPTDVIATHAAMLGKAPAGETPSIPAYMGKLVLISSLILSIPVAAFLYFSLGLMDRYVIHNFLSPFLMCLFSFMSIWFLADFTDNGDALAALSFTGVVTFYVTQIPFVVLFSLPIAGLLSALYAMSKMSKANEFICMVGAGRSVSRILTPLIITGAYVSLIGLAFKYQWAPEAVGYKKAVIKTALQEKLNKVRTASMSQDKLWAHQGWMYINEVDRRSWFVGKVPWNLSEPMEDIVITETDDDDQPKKIWIAHRAQWVWNAAPPKWILSEVRVYDYGSNHVPLLSSQPRLEITEWSETPWKVLSSSQNPEYLGLPNLQMYLNAHQDVDARGLAPYWTSRWNVFAEPLSCLALILAAAPLGIVYSRRGVMGGVSGAICIFAFMYVMRATMSALGNIDRIPPFLAAWTTNFIVAGIGLAILWFRAKNRDIPSIKSLWTVVKARRTN